jgi:hypothetical protein
MAWRCSVRGYVTPTRDAIHCRNHAGRKQSDCRLKTVGGLSPPAQRVEPVKLRRWLCITLSLVKLHRAGCEQCGKFESCWGNDIRRRLQELQAFEQTKPETAIPTKSFNDDAA